MKIDCYNACSCYFSDLEFGDVFYYLDTLWLKVFDATWNNPDRGLAVRLDTGSISPFEFSESVIKANAKVVAENPL